MIFVWWDRCVQYDDTPSFSGGYVVGSKLPILTPLKRGVFIIGVNMGRMSSLGSLGKLGGLGKMGSLGGLGGLGKIGGIGGRDPRTSETIGQSNP